MATPKEAIIAANYEQYMAGAQECGLSKKEAQELWDMILKFAGYGFNKSHSTAYALVAWQTAYLKTHYPVEFMAALLTGDIPGRNFTSKDSLVEHLEDCQRMDVEVVFPDINSSDVRFTVADEKIHFAMSAIKGCGASAAEAIVRERKANGPFKDIYDLCERVDSSECNRSSLETLIKAGAMDCFGANRSQLTAVLDRAIQSGAAAQADKRSGQKNLFGAFEEEEVEEEQGVVDLPDLPEWEEREKLSFEKEVLGFYLSSHPLAEFIDQLKQFCSHNTSGLAGTKDGDRVTMGGMVSSIKHSHTKNPRSPDAPTKYVMFDLEDVEGSIRSILWPQDFAQHGHLITPDAVVVLQGRLDFRGGGDEANLIVNNVIPIDQLDQSLTNGIKIMIDQQIHGDAGLKNAYEILRGYPGGRRLKVEVCLENGIRVQMDSSKKIDINDQLCRRLRELLGNSGVEMLVDRKALSGKSNGEKRYGRR
ncbi:MAG: OB-fold nucleic acid binding domain-containing protein [Planctomycetota bacterium]